MAKEKKETKTRSRLSKLECDYIDLNWTKKTDKEMSVALGRDVKTIFAYRQKRGYSKHKDASFKPETPVIMNDGSISLPAKEMSSRLTDIERKEFFSGQLKNSKFYTLLAKAFSQDELDFYCEEYGALCVQFSDILSSERRQLDELIRTQILINRILSHVQKTEEEIEIFGKQIDDFRKNHDMKEDQEAQTIDDENIYRIRQMANASQQMANDYTKLVNLKNSILESLNARRKDRIEQLSNSKTTFAGLVEAIRQEDAKNAQGKYIEYVKMARDKKKKQWSKPSKYCDGSVDIILYDENSDIEELTKNSREMIEKISEIPHEELSKVTDSRDDSK